MVTVEDVVCKAKELAQNAGKKTGELVNLGKLKLEAAETAHEISERYEMIGKYVYEAHKNGADATEKLQSLFEKVDVLQQKAAELEAQINELRRMKHCEECGCQNPKAAQYCQKCGKKL